MNTNNLNNINNNKENNNKELNETNENETNENETNENLNENNLSTLSNSILDINDQSDELNDNQIIFKEEEMKETLIRIYPINTWIEKLFFNSKNSFIFNNGLIKKHSYNCQGVKILNPTYGNSCSIHFLPNNYYEIEYLKNKINKILCTTIFYIFNKNYKCTITIKTFSETKDKVHIYYSVIKTEKLNDDLNEFKENFEKLNLKLKNKILKWWLQFNNYDKFFFSDDKVKQYFNINSDEHKFI